jgi:hypothetical protein
LVQLSIVPVLVVIGQGVFSQQTPENWPFSLKAYIAHTTLHCTTVHAYDQVTLSPIHFKISSFPEYPCIFRPRQFITKSAQPVESIQPVLATRPMNSAGPGPRTTITQTGKFAREIPT